MGHEITRLGLSVVFSLFVACSGLTLGGHVAGLVIFHLRHGGDVRRLNGTGAKGRRATGSADTLWGHFGFWNLRNEAADAVISPAARRTRRAVGLWFMRPASVLGAFLALIAVGTMIAMFATGFDG